MLIFQPAARMHYVNYNRFSVFEPLPPASGHFQSTSTALQIRFRGFSWSFREISRDPRTFTHAFDRAEKALRYGIMLSLAVGTVMFWLSFFHGISLASLFARDMEVAAAGADYLKAYAIDCLLTPIFFCFIGFYNGIGMTRFVMMQGIVSAFCVRVPVSFLMSKRVPVSLFHIGLATPFSSALQIVMCLVCMAWVKARIRKNGVV